MQCQEKAVAPILSASVITTLLIAAVGSRSIGRGRRSSSSSSGSRASGTTRFHSPRKEREFVSKFSVPPPKSFDLAGQLFELT